ncbi:RecQ family ATP-dependent DNA helicase [Flavobacteriaceae bacterium M23B6Z8]
MNSIIFIDLEVNPRTRRILDFGAIKENENNFHDSDPRAFKAFLEDFTYLCGHNIIKHDYRYLKPLFEQKGLKKPKCIDTLYLSPLLFPQLPYHALLKDDKLQTEELNNPLNDAIKCKELFYSEVAAFRSLPIQYQQLYTSLLASQKEFSAFFSYMGITHSNADVAFQIKSLYRDKICDSARLDYEIKEHPIALAYALALINVQDRYSITPRWVLHQYPDTERILFLLRNKPCLKGCTYCQQATDIHLALKRYFGYDDFRKYHNEPLQEDAVRAAVHQASLLAVFPTGGGKSLTFQVPALISGENYKALTVVISPLQSLMKDQVDNLEKKQLTEAVTINGLLDPIERAKAFERVEQGRVSLVYIAPESLRSKSIRHLLLARTIARFVIDEAHCFSSWGQDFRVDYMYIADFIKEIQQLKNLSDPIPVSCFTATANQRVITDILAYFKEKLGLELEVFRTTTHRRNLSYRVFSSRDDDKKYEFLRDMVSERSCPVIVYVSKTRTAEKLAGKLREDGFMASAFHGKMDKDEKTQNQNAFMQDEIQVMVATTAFGMGVDKSNVGLVIHFDISDSLENYVQESGRAGRDQSLKAECYVLFNQDDLNKHFLLLNQTKLSIKEIKQVWKAIKALTRNRNEFSHSALEIARKAGWHDGMHQIETRVTSAIAALEVSGYLKRGQNSPRVYASSIETRTAQEAIERIRKSALFSDKERVTAERIIKKLFSSKSRQQSTDEVAESRVDYISEHLGLVKEKVIRVINLMRQEGVLGDAKDLSAFIETEDHQNKSEKKLKEFAALELFLLNYLNEEEMQCNLKELNEAAVGEGIGSSTLHRLKTIINFWAIKNLFKRQLDTYSGRIMTFKRLHESDVLYEKVQQRHEIALFIINYLFKLHERQKSVSNSHTSKPLINFSVVELRKAYEQKMSFFKKACDLDAIEDALFYLSRIEAIKIEGGFLVVYNRLHIERKELDNYVQYKKEDYAQLAQFYTNRVEQIHIVGEYARKMLSNYREALQFVEDYFQLNYSSFLRKYFKGERRNDLRRNITPEKFQQVFGTLSPSQLAIVRDSESKHIAVLAGPGSGKTRVLVHKLASLMLMEDVKHEQLLMLTFSRAAVTEFKKRLLGLIGNAAHFVEIKTFHSYCFDLLGRVGTLEKTADIIKEAVLQIRNGAIEMSQITKTFLVIDEAQDMEESEYLLVEALIEVNEDLSVLMVGDDDQNIYEFRGASSRFLEDFIRNHQATPYELLENYRSKTTIVALANAFVKTITDRLKRTPIFSKEQDTGKVIHTQYQQTMLMVPLVEEIANTYISGSCGVLTVSNEEAAIITSLLLKKGIPARLVQSNSNFSLKNLYELDWFLEQINQKDTGKVIFQEHWDACIKLFNTTFERSTHKETVMQLLKDFNTLYPKTKFHSDFETYITESKLEDFINVQGETILVSTIHKAKGREFDTVFLMLSNQLTATDRDRRTLYVALTRAKDNLYIHSNKPILPALQVEGLTTYQDTKTYGYPDELLLQANFTEVYLDYFISRQQAVSKLMAGDSLLAKESKLYTLKGETIVQFSKSFEKKLGEFYAKGYRLKSAKVYVVVYWTKEETQQRIRVLLPEVVLQKDS